MAEIAGIGANVFDTLITLDEYPAEDTKKKAESIKISGGGPCATGLVAASKLGADTVFLGQASDDEASSFLLKDFEKYNVSTEYINILKGYKAFSSYILLSEETVSRTCIFHRGSIPPLGLDDSKKEQIKEAKVLMIDGNEMDAAEEGAKIARLNQTLVLYDAGGLYEGVERLLRLTDILIPSEEFAKAYTKEDSVENAAKKLYDTFLPKVVVITMGKDGGIMYDGKEFKKYPAFLVDAIDSNGSGDVFHGAFAFCLTRGFDYYKACVFSSGVSALKCTKLGAREGVPTYDEVIEFLKERGINV